MPIFGQFLFERMAQKDCMKWNNCMGWKFTLKLINVGYEIRACWVEKIMKINKRTPTFIRYSRVFIDYLNLSQPSIANHSSLNKQQPSNFGNQN